MTRFIILLGFALMFALIHQQGQLNKYINTKYAYLSVSAIILLLIMCLIEFIRLQQLDKAKQRQAADDGLHQEQTQDCEHGQCHEHSSGHHHAHDHHDHVHQDHDHDDFGLSHEPSSKWKRTLGYLILFFPIATGIFLPVQTLDSSFVKAKGFTLPVEQEYMTDDTPGEHQFLKPDSSVFYGKEGYEKLKNKELEQFINRGDVVLDDDNYMKGMEVIYNYPGEFMGDTITFEGFAYKGEQVDDNYYFIFRFGFIHCAADSGIFGMLVQFPKGTELQNDDWVRVKGKLASEFYQPFKQTIPVLKVGSWESIPEPEDPYVYRNY